MDPSEQLKIAGEAAGLLEDRGFTAVARMSSGVVTLELWKHHAGEHRSLRHVVQGEVTAEGLAQRCAAMFEAATGGEAD